VSPAALDRLALLADELAADWAVRGRAWTTAGCERALLRLFGVDGLDRAGRPLAWSVVERYTGMAPERLADGVGLPFAIALLEYDVEPQELALDVAAGIVDLAFEGRLLDEADRRASAEAEANRLLEAAVERVDANRTARAELRSVLGDAERPRLGTILDVATAAEARRLAPALARAGADAVFVATPSGRELVERLSVAGLEVVRWQPPPVGQGAGRGEPAAGSTTTEPPAPAGSQRGLAVLRRALDEAAAERGAYVRIATSAPALGAPEQAVVAVLERVDLVVADPFREIVDEGVDPIRAIADHVFAHRLVRRSGAQLVVGPGPLVIGPDLATGRPSDAAARLGRALALVAVAVGLARRAGLAPGDVVVDALPAWLVDEPDPTRLAAAAVALQRAIFPGHPLVLRRPSSPEAFSPSAWVALAATLLPVADPVELVVDLRLVPDEVDDAARAMRMAASGAVALRALVGQPSLGGSEPGLVHTAVEAGLEYLERLRDGGPAAILGGGDPGGGNGRRPIRRPIPGAGGAVPGTALSAADRPMGFGGDAVAERRGGFDPLALLDR
jgi:hypothetical protein